MYGLDWAKGHVHCSFCGEVGHNITSCNRISEIYKATEYQIRTHWHDGSLIEGSDQIPPNMVVNWCSLSTRQARAYTEMNNREKRQIKRQQNKYKKKKPRCSFCRKENHRRPACKHHKRFSKRVFKANIAWREKFIDFVNVSGLGIGSLIKIPKSIYLWYAEADDFSSCLLVAYSIEGLNVFSSHRKRDEYRTKPYFILAESETGKEIKISFEKIKAFVEYGLGHSTWHNQGIKVISPTPWYPPKGWAENGENVELSYVLNKISMSSKEFPMIYSFIDTWVKDEKNE